MKAPVLQWLFIPLFLFGGGAFADSLSQAEVLAALAEADKAIKALDADGVGEVISETAAISMHLTMGGYRESMTVNRNRYVEMLKEAWANYDHYDYVRDSVEVTISEDGREALVKAVVRESMVVRGEATESVSREEMTFRRIDGKLLITGVESWTTM